MCRQHKDDGDAASDEDNNDDFEVHEEPQLTPSIKEVQASIYEHDTVVFPVSEKH